MARLALLHDVFGVTSQQGIFGSSEIVLGGITNAVEQLRTVLVIEILGMETLRMCAQTGAHIIRQAGAMTGGLDFTNSKII